MSVSIGKVILTTSANHLRSFNEDYFILQENKAVVVCKLQCDVQNNVIDCRTSNAVQETHCELLNSWKSDKGYVIVKSTDIRLVHNGQIDKHKYQPTKLPILGCCNFGEYVVTVTSDHYTVCNLQDLTTHTNSINVIKKCTAIIAGWHKNIVVDKRSMRHIDILICDGSKVYHYLGDLVSVIDTGRVLAFCKNQFGYLAAFETNWRLSPMHLFSDNPINLESLEIPRNHTSYNEARLQLYSYDLECVDDHTLPGHNEPTLLVERSNIVCVSGFYKHVISIFLIKNGAINHLKDLSIGLESRCAGLALKGNNNLLVLKRRFNTDNILLTFPSKTGSIEGYASIENIKLGDHITIDSVSISPQNMFDVKRPKPDGSNRLPTSQVHNITDEDIEQKAREILEDYRQNPRTESFSDSELSEGTLELLADCRPRHPFIPIPVSDSSGASDNEDSEMLEPGKLILPLREIINSNPLIREVLCDSNVSNEVRSSSDTPTELPANEEVHGHVGINSKLDVIIALLEKQNTLLEIIAKQKSND